MDDLVIFWPDMGDAEEFMTVETSHREAVEYLVQRQLRTILARGKPALTVISKVRSNRAVQLPIVRDSAEQVVESFRGYFDGLNP
ncbi:hypothetical protein A8W25_28495 [Streptomyces sp. ERV7]|nr:hypothetical protein A8W25_28495 [Streptomyces sp. ERV7]